MKPGFAFGDHIRTEKVRKRRYDTDKPREFRLRGYIFLLVLFVAAGILYYNLFSLQVIHGAEYRLKADTNRLRTQIIHAPRGIVFDRNGKPLILNIPGFREILPSSQKSGGTRSVVISKDKAINLIAKGYRNIEVDSLRQYPYKDVMSHILGYIGQISSQELAEQKTADYQPTDWIGKGGIEGEYENLLRGQDGKRLIEVDAFGKPVRILGQTDPVPGEDITLTVDAQLQQEVYDGAKDIKNGAVIVSRPDGEILSMVSKPSFDPNLFTLDNTYKTASDSAYTSLEGVLEDSANQPVLNRSIAGLYPPGSTFKIVVAASGLGDQVIDDRFTIEDTGVVKVGDFSFANWYYTEYGKKESGPVNVVRALARSNDIFFYKLAEKIGVDKLSETAKKFGLGEKLGIDLGGEEAGLVPTTQWKKDNLKEDWFLGDTYHYGIGQGYLLTTPLQVNSWTQVVANGGTLYEPRLLKKQELRIKNQGLISKKNVNLIRQGMIDACSTGGVAWPLFDFKVKNANLKVDGENYLNVASSSADMRKVAIACKTGTAEHGSPTTEPHAWITLFAPAYNPEIVVTVLVESGGEGSNVAAPIAKKILEDYFGSKK